MMITLKRYLYDQVLKDVKKKMVFITGPRQVGKTFLAKQIMTEFQKPQYLNYDNLDDRNIVQNMSWKLNADLLYMNVKPLYNSANLPYLLFKSPKRRRN